MNKIRYALITVIIFALSTNSSHSETIVSTKYANYQISGNNINEIQTDLLTKGFKHKSGNIFTAETSAKFAWKYNFTKSQNGCSIKSVDVEVEIIYSLPQLVNYEDLKQDNKTEWGRYANSTYTHEQGHAKISIETAKEIEWEARNIIPKDGCGEMARAANKLISNVLKRHEYKNLAYDNETGHGTTQGAVFASK